MSSSGGPSPPMTACWRIPLAWMNRLVNVLPNPLGSPGAPETEPGPLGVVNWVCMVFSLFACAKADLPKPVVAIRPSAESAALDALSIRRRESHFVLCMSFAPLCIDLWIHSNRCGHVWRGTTGHVVPAVPP